VLFTRTTTAMPAGSRNADIWVVAADGSTPSKPFITSPKSENSPRWLPDGSVAFISSRDGAPQVYVADSGGAKARAVTRLSGGVQPPFVVSPDGKKVAFVSDVFPSCADEACNKRMRDAVEIR
jgi:Tol biopolymer transport system component